MNLIDTNHRLKDILSEILTLEAQVKREPEIRDAYETRFSVAMLQLAIARWSDGGMLKNPNQYTGNPPETH